MTRKKHLAARLSSLTPQWGTVLVKAETVVPHLCTA
jgi:hypothetical protein